ncbi:MAG TPA: T9SS type A sorting domain-containing protein, partial [Bacteroidales bacterium]|nr:T9SS type A sorting domain-containing protein [Bacteroidales bacterium]
RDIITLELTPPAESGHVVIEIYNLMGQNLINKNLESKPQYQLDLTGLQNGVYLLKVTHGKTPAFKKLIKQ